MNTKDPDELLKETNRSTLTKAMLISTVIHFVLIFGTSFGLYADWVEVGGIHSPSTIKQMRAKSEKDAADEERRVAAEKRAVVMAAAAEAAPAPKPAATPAPTPPQASPAEPDLEPLPPKEGFTLGEDFTL